jgi:hypothetical protein
MSKQIEEPMTENREENPIMPIGPSYPVRLDAKLLDAVRAVAKREGRTLKSQLEWFLRAAVSGQKP